MYDQVATLPYDPIAQRYWALEEHAGRVAYEIVTALVIVNGAGTPVTSPLNAGERYLRIRESTGHVTFEISIDKQTWRALRELPDPFGVDDVMIGSTVVRTRPATQTP
jgi:hypothetical protein